MAPKFNFQDTSSGRSIILTTTWRTRAFLIIKTREKYLCLFKPGFPWLILLDFWPRINLKIAARSSGNPTNRLPEDGYLSPMKTPPGRRKVNSSPEDRSPLTHNRSERLFIHGLSNPYIYSSTCPTMDIEPFMQCLTNLFFISKIAQR